MKLNQNSKISVVEKQTRSCTAQQNVRDCHWVSLLRPVHEGGSKIPYCIILYLLASHRPRKVMMMADKNCREMERVGEEKNPTVDNII